ncbi:fatty acid-binding protein 5 isoform X2 [Fukomys damarensis]|uniref:fatty acid-binding protein 5 isoform X2 n=1 Tax=Fukomys damarensis TaxID=885580 RepID=UPI0005400D70|nr:fatty acid-binding protein 5 isoform X2 [Fukomys damarensis]
MHPACWKVREVCCLGFCKRVIILVVNSSATSLCPPAVSTWVACPPLHLSSHVTHRDSAYPTPDLAMICLLLSTWKPSSPPPPVFHHCRGHTGHLQFLGPWMFCYLTDFTKLRLVWANCLHFYYTGARIPLQRNLAITEMPEDLI